MKHLKTLLLILAASLLLVACGSGGGGGDDSGGDVPGVDNSEGSNASSLVGTWELTKIQNGSVTENIPPGYLILTLGEEEWSRTFIDCTRSGYYTVSHNTLITTTTYDCDGDTNESSETANFTVNETTLTLLYDDGESVIFARM